MEITVLIILGAVAAFALGWTARRVLAGTSPGYEYRTVTTEDGETIEMVVDLGDPERPGA